MKTNLSKRWRDRLLAILFSAVILALSGVFIANSLRVYNQSRDRTQQYLDDVTHQLHAHIETQIQKSLEMLRLIRSIALGLPQEELPVYLSDQTSYSGFSSLHIVDDLNQAEAWLQQCYGSRYTLDRELFQQGRAQLLAIPEESAGIYFAAGTTDQDATVIIGVKETDLLQKLLSENNFDGKAITLAITRAGTIITSSSEQNFFDRIALSYKGSNYPEAPEWFEQMKEDLLAGESGTLSFPSATGERLLLSYRPLSFSDWGVFTVIPADALNAGVEDLTMQNLILTLVTVLLLMGGSASLLILQRRYTQRLEHTAFTDEITGGWNNLRFRLEAERVLRRDSGYTMVSLDIMDFTFLNNIYGVQAGDDVLRYIYTQICHWLQAGELTARSSADLFYILMHTQAQDEIVRRITALDQHIRDYDRLGGGSYRIEMRFGAYPIRDGSRSITWMEDNANLARKYRDGQRCSFYRTEKWQEQKLEREMINDMPSSLRSGAFEVYLQPKVRLRDGCIDGAEALIRWNHPDKGMLPPGVFIPVLEKARLISQLDRFMFEEVCKLLRRWRQEGRETCVISVNLSRQNLAIPDLLAQYRAICERYGVPPASIELELTESIFMENTEWMRRFICEMHAQGFQCSLDDFGAGYSSLGLLKELDIDVIKLDRSFFETTEEGEKGELIVKAILDLARQLHIRTVAEGIEQPAQVKP